MFISFRAVDKVLLVVYLGAIYRLCLGKVCRQVWDRCDQRCGMTWATQLSRDLDL